MHSPFSDIEILYCDNHILSARKPPGMPVQADKSGDRDLLTSLKEWLAQEYNKPGNVFLGLVHRLDRPVGGAMVLARTSKAAARLSDQFRRGCPGKTYLTIVKGAPPAKQDRLIHHLLKDKTNNQTAVYDQPLPGSKEARLHYQVLATAEKFSLLRVVLETGRSHQIRAQMAAVGCPIYGDRRYGTPSEPREWAENVGTTVPVALWSHQLKLEHPTQKKTITFKSPPPVEEYPWSLFEKDVAG